MPSGIPTHRYGDESITPAKLHDDILETGFGFYDGSMQPFSSKLDGYTSPTGTTGDTNIALFPGTCGFSAQYHVKGTQTLLAPLLDTAGKGLDISQDQTDNDGVEYVFGTINSNSPFAWTVGTHNGFVEIRFEIADVSGTDDCAVGVRKLEAFTANFDDYDELAAINVISGDIKVETILNGATTTTTDSTQNWADGETHTLRVDLIGRLASFSLDGSPLSSVSAFTFDSGEVVVPFAFFLQATTSPGKVWWKHVKVGRQRAVSSTGNGN
jgi:hypothetical protein